MNKLIFFAVIFDPTDRLPQVYGIIEVINSGYEVDPQGQVV